MQYNFQALKRGVILRGFHNHLGKQNTEYAAMIAANWEIVVALLQARGAKPLDRFVRRAFWNKRQGYAIRKGGPVVHPSISGQSFVHCEIVVIPAGDAWALVYVCPRTTQRTQPFLRRDSGAQESHVISFIARLKNQSEEIQQIDH